MRKNTSNYDAAWLGERTEYFEGMYKDILQLKESGVFSGKRIAIVGCWNNAAEINNIIGKLNMSISIIADNNPNKQGISRLGIISQSVESLTLEENIVILVLNNLFWRDIQNQLLKLGFIEDSDFFVVFGGQRFQLESGGFDETSLISDQVWSKFCLYAKKGYRSYLELTQKYPGLPIWLMHQPSIGDLYIFALFLPTAMSVKNTADCDCVLVVTKNSTRKLAEVIGFKTIEMFSFEEGHYNWLAAMRIMGDKMPYVRNAVYHGLNAVFQSLVWNTRVTFRDSFTKYVFHFTKEVEPIYPQFPKRSDIVRAEFEKQNLKMGKTVIISPYAGHFEATISSEQWQRLIKSLMKKGYSICTNCGGPNEPPLPGTVPAFIELQDCVEFAETAGYFIGVRSGFCDLLCMADCQKIVIYETGAPAASIDYFGFESMGIGDGKIIEVINDCIRTDELIDQILAYL